MSATPPVTIVLDISALAAATPREWVEFSRVGSCVIPQVVYEEMKLLYDRSPDPDLEQIAKSFTRFYPNSGWKTSEVNGHHPLLKVTSGQSLPRRARVSLAVGRCAYGIAQSMPNTLVVVASSEQNLLQRIYELQIPNLCGITGQSLLQWCRTGHRPIAASQKIQQIKAVTHSGITSPGAEPTTASSRSYSTSSRLSSSTYARNTKIRPATSIIPDWLPQVFSLISSLVALGIAGWLIWLLIDHTGMLDQFFSPEESEQQPTSGSLYQTSPASSPVALMEYITSKPAG